MTTTTENFGKRMIDRVCKADKKKWQQPWTSPSNTESTDNDEEIPLFKGVKTKRNELAKMLDLIYKERIWVCPIIDNKDGRSYYSISRDVIEFPPRDSFTYVEAFYGTLLHEMIHSTGRKDWHNRFDSENFTKSNFMADEEILTEMTSALLMTQFNMEKYAKKDSASYLRSWADSISKNPTELYSTLKDVNALAEEILNKLREIYSRWINR